jgi:hypothetical protein
LRRKCYTCTLSVLQAVHSAIFEVAHIPGTDENVAGH